MAQPYYINPALANPFIRQYREWDWWDARGKQECESEYLPQVAVQDTQMRLVVRLRKLSLECAQV